MGFDPVRAGVQACLDTVHTGAEAVDTTPIDRPTNSMAVIRMPSSTASVSMFHFVSLLIAVTRRADLRRPIPHSDTPMPVTTDCVRRDGYPARP